MTVTVTVTMTATPATTAHRLIFSVILAGYLVIAGLFAVRTPAWQAPDEPAHYNYVRQVAAGTLIPVIQMGDWDNAYLETLKAARFAPALLQDLDTIRYENHQPPLYYWLLAPVFALTGGDLVALRLVSLLFGAGTVALAWHITRAVLPAAPWLAAAVMGLVAFLPQHVAIVAAVNNDALSGLLVALTLWLALRYTAGAALSPAWIGLGVGLIFVTKTTGYLMAGVALVALLLRARSPAGALRPLLSFALPAGVLALLWWGRNLAVYGLPDFLGLRAHDAIVVGQLRTAEYIAQIGPEAYVSRALATTFQSFWGQFGWMGVPMFDIPAPGLNIIYPALLLLCLVALAGLFVSPAWRSLPLAARGLLLLVIALTALMYLYYNLTFVQFQGRYLFTALIPLALGLVCGLEAWRARLLPRAPAALLVLPLLLALLNLWLIWRVIPGALAPA
ncbi:MAG: glycosyltransferase family 39 protein [Anaerolineae bacterium]|nr:glycosyltransferase family 39 protein [Anaerolineae bacterium]